VNFLPNTVSANPICTLEKASHSVNKSGQNVYEIDTWCQFHHHVMSSFLPASAAFLYLQFESVFLGQKAMAKKYLLINVCYI